MLSSSQHSRSREGEGCAESQPAQQIEGEGYTESQPARGEGERGMVNFS